MGPRRLFSPLAVAAALALAAAGCASHPSAQQATPANSAMYDCRTDPWSSACGPYYYPEFWPYPGYVLVPVVVVPAVPIPPLPPPHPPKPPRRPPHLPRAGFTRPCRVHAGSVKPVCP